MTFEALLKDLRGRVYHPVYFLQGEEPYFIDEISNYIADNVLSDMEKEFNQTILYGKETDALTVISNAKRYPMMASHQVVIVKEAQELKNIDLLASYVENPLSSTVLVLCHKYKSLDKRTKLAKLLASKSVFFESPRLYDNKIPDWVEKYAGAREYRINPKAALMVAEYLGNDLSKIANELDKLMLNVPKGTEIAVKHIEENIGISKEYNIFELQNALSRKDVLKANQIARYFAANPKSNPLVVSLGSLYTYFSKILVYHSLPDKSKAAVASALKINPYFVGDYEAAARSFPMSKAVSVISTLRDCDLKSKGVNNASADDGQLLKELVYRILH
jgi:DNA polymerase III subunit delta